MTTRRQRQAEAEARRKELVEQLERDRERVKKAGEQVREFGEACREVLGVIEFTGEESSEATDILNEAAEDEMIEKIVDEIVEETESVELLEKVPGSSYVLKDVPWNEFNAEPCSFQSPPANQDAVICDRQSRKLTDEEAQQAVDVAGPTLDCELPEFHDKIIDLPATEDHDTDKATPSGDGWE